MFSNPAFVEVGTLQRRVGAVCVISALGLMVACGSDDAPGEADATGSGGGSTSSSGGGGDVPVTPSDIDSIVLEGMGTLSVGAFDLFGGRDNAREAYQVAHYIGRTHGEDEEDKVHIPMRSYVATCGLDTEQPRVFVSLSLRDSEEDGAPTHGSVYELRYDPSTGGLQPTENRAFLNQCYESHGIAASPDCSRVAVLCNTPYKASESYPIDKDIVAEHGTPRMQEEDNHAKASDPAKYKQNDQIWLLEWDGDAPLSETPATYVVNKMHGGTHLGAQELLYVDNDSQGRSSYAFSVTARAFDNGGGSHYSAGLTVIHRNDWSTSMTSSDGRGWDWSCGDGHVANIRAFYNPDVESYGAICTSDWNDWMGNAHGVLGTIAIKDEHWSSAFEGLATHFVPSSNAMVTNGGGHKVIPIDDSTNLALIVAPKLIADEDMDRFLTDRVGVDASQPGPFDQECEDYNGLNNCFMTYLMEDYEQGTSDYPSIEQQGLWNDDPLEARSLSRIGLAKVGERGSIVGSGYRWIVEDADCQVSDPQMVDLQNGRYLLGYALFQCVSDGEGYNRIGDKRSIIPRSFHLMEMDQDGNVLAGPFDIGDHGWGGLDDIQVLGPGRAAWVYKPKPTLGTEDGPLANRWNTYLYESAN